MEAPKPKIVLVDPFADLPEEEEGERVTVRFQPYDCEIRARKGRTLLENAKMEGVKLPHACGGRARCATCRVRVLAGAGNLTEMDVVERRTLQQYSVLKPGFRLSCRAKLAGDCEVHVEMTPEQAHSEWTQTGSNAWRPRGGWK